MIKNEKSLHSLKLKRNVSLIILLTFFACICVYFGVITGNLLTEFDSPRHLEPNQIGDTIGGLLSPFIALVAAILIYITIEQQIEANRIIQDQFKIQKVLEFEKTIFSFVQKRLKGILTEVDNVTYRDSFGGEINLPSSFTSFQIYLSKRQFYNLKGSKPEFEDIEQKNFSESFSRLTRTIKFLEFYTENIIEQDAFKIILRDDIKKLLNQFQVPVLDFMVDPNYPREVNYKFDLNNIYQSITKGELNCSNLEKIKDLLHYKEELPMVSNNGIEQQIRKFLNDNLQDITQLNILYSKAIDSRQWGGISHSLMTIQERTSFVNSVQKAKKELPVLYKKMKGSGVYIHGDDPEFPK